MSCSLLHADAPIAERCAVIDAESATYKIVLDVPAAGGATVKFYAWASRVETPMAAHRRQLAGHVRRVFAAGRGIMREARFALTSKSLRWCSVGLVSAALLASSGCGADTRSLDNQPEAITHVVGPTWKGLESLAASSDLVVLATAKTAKPGRIVGEGGGELRFREVSLEVERVVFSRGPASPGSVTFEEEAWDAGVGIELEGRPWTQVGDRGYFFLRKDPIGAYVFVGQQGRILIRDGRVIPSGDPGLKAVSRLRALTPDALAASIANAVTTVRAKNLPKMPRGDGAG